MANGRRHGNRDTQFGPERLRARAIDLDPSAGGLHQGAQPPCCRSDAVYMAATDQPPEPYRALAPREPSIHGPSTMASGPGDQQVAVPLDPAAGGDTTAPQGRGHPLTAPHPRPTPVSMGHSGGWAGVRGGERRVEPLARRYEIPEQRPVELAGRPVVDVLECRAPTWRSFAARIRTWNFFVLRLAFAGAKRFTGSFSSPARRGRSAARATRRGWDRRRRRGPAARRRVRRISGPSSGRTARRTPCRRASARAAGRVSDGRAWFSSSVAILRPPDVLMRDRRPLRGRLGPVAMQVVLQDRGDRAVGHAADLEGASASGLEGIAAVWPGEAHDGEACPEALLGVGLGLQDQVDEHAGAGADALRLAADLARRPSRVSPMARGQW